MSLCMPVPEETFNIGGSHPVAVVDIGPEDSHEQGEDFRVGWTDPVGDCYVVHESFQCLLD